MSTTSLSVEKIREFVIFAHWNLDKVKEMVEAEPELLQVQYDWGENGLEDGLAAAAHVGNRPIAEFFLSRGLPMNICVAAMLGDLDAVRGFLAQNPELANARGAHGITLMYHAAQSGSISVVEALKAAGCTEGYSHALHAAINHKHPAMANWLLDNGAADVNARDFQNKTPLQHALEAGQQEIAELLSARGAAL
jgi:ankyrin repeat protein